MISKTFLLTALISIFVWFAGCAPVISRNLQENVPQGLTFREVKDNPQDYIGETVVWGGEIIETTNIKEGTRIEVLQKPLNYQLKPKPGDVTYGQYFALYEQYLDPAVYSKGRRITMGGEIKGKKTASLGEIEYTYPVVSVKEIHLWPEKREDVYPDYYPYYYPYPLHWRWWHHPYWVY